MTTTVQQPQPDLSEPDTRAFWEATRNHELRYQRCNACDGVVFYPRRHCTHCLSLDLRWKLSRGEGTVYTYSVVRLNRAPAFRDLGPYAVAWVDLDEGFRMLTNIVDVADPTTEIKVGQRVRLAWEDQESGISLPMFTPA